MKQMIDVAEFCQRMKGAAGGCDGSMCDGCAIQKAKKIVIVTCGECRHRDKEDCCTKWDVDDYKEARVRETDFCSYGDDTEE